jgi:hypothetical protein
MVVEPFVVPTFPRIESARPNLFFNKVKAGAEMANNLFAAFAGWIFAPNECPIDQREHDGSGKNQGLCKVNARCQKQAQNYSKRSE